MSRVLLLSCRSPFLDDSKIYCPMANLYLKSFLNHHLPSTQVVLGDDNYDLEHPESFEEFDFIGLSIMTPQREEASKLLKIIKEHAPHTKVVAGGPHCKHYLDDVMKEPYDFIVPLDGERAFLQIVSGTGTDRVVWDVMKVPDILAQPRPDRSSANAQQVIKGYHYKLGTREATTMMTARGCPEKCTFCEDAMTIVKWSSIDNLRAEMDDIKSMGYQGVYIFDDLFAIAMPKIKPICEALKKRDLQYRCNGQVRYFTKWQDDFAKLLSSTGCVEMAFGFESGSQTILDNVRKRTTVEMNYKAVEYAQKQGIKVKGFVMLGLPGETHETIAETERFIATSGMDDFQLAIYFPYKGTQIRDAIDTGGASIDMMVVGEGLGAYGQKGGSTESVVRTKALSAEELLSERDRIVKTYRPQSHAHKWQQDHFFDTHLANGGTV